MNLDPAPDATLASLEAMPIFLRSIGATLHADTHARPPADGAFSFVEHAWHLADLEDEAFAVRIARMRAEQSPALPDFDGDRAAHERRYRELDAREAVARFTKARAANMTTLASLSEAERGREAVQDGVGRLCLGEMAGRMLAHDRAHAAELVGLVVHVSPGLAEALRRFAFPQMTQASP